MKLFLASALVALSAKNASAFRIVQTRDDTYCVMVVPNDGSWAAADLLTTPTTVLTNGDDGPTVGPNGVNDPNGNILAAAQSAWAGGAYSGFTLYGGDGTTALTVPPQNGDTLFPATLGFCKLYSTQAPSHYCKGDGAYDPWQQSNWGDSIDECCQNNHAAEYNECFKVSAGVVSSHSFLKIVSFQHVSWCSQFSQSPPLFLSPSPSLLTPHTHTHTHSPAQQTQGIGTPTTRTKCVSVNVT